MKKIYQFLLASSDTRHAILVSLALVTMSGWFVYAYSIATEMSDKMGCVAIGAEIWTITSADGFTFSVNEPQGEAVNGNTPLGDPFSVYWANSNSTELTLYSDGYYYSSESVRYTDNGDGTYSGADGTVLYDYDPVSAAVGENTEETEETAEPENDAEIPEE